MAHGRAHVAALGAADRARRARPGAALGVPGELRDRVRRARPQGLTVLAYYSVAAPQEFWTDHWGRYSVEELLAIARRSPLTRLITQALPDDGVILEAGCGLGQYVLLLRERGWRVAGVDWSLEALAACRRAAPAPLALMELRGLAIADGVLSGYISLGVIEHDPDGPDAILVEAHRVLAPGGVLVVSVPYVNGVRRLAAGWIRHRNREIAVLPERLLARRARGGARALRLLGARRASVRSRPDPPPGPPAAHSSWAARCERRRRGRVPGGSVAAATATDHARHAFALHRAGAAAARPHAARRRPEGLTLYSRRWPV